MKKLTYPTLVLDLDGTLLSKDKIISKTNLSELKRYQSQGGRIILASGRNSVSVAWHARLLGISGWHIASDGNALIYLSENFSKEETIYMKNMDSDFLPLLKEISSFASTQSMIFHPKGIILQPGNLVRLPFIEHQFPAAEDHHFPRPPSWDDFLPLEITSNWYEKALNIPTVYRSVIFADDNLSSIQQLLSQYKYASANLSSDGRSFELSPVGINKGNTLIQLSDQLGFSLEGTMALGDGLNDIALLSAVKMGIAMKNAPDLVKKVAYTTSTHDNNQSGVAREISKWAYK